jgi:purine-binding chemotaxis protein CheW
MEALLFELSRETFGLWLSSVREVARAVSPVTLPGAPANILGVIRFRGSVLPVFDLRARFGKPTRAPLLSDRLIIAKVRKRLVALAVDHVEGITDIAEAQLDDGRYLPRDLAGVAGIAALADGLVVIRDLEAFLSQAEEAQLDHALEAAAV